MPAPDTLQNENVSNVPENASQRQAGGEAAVPGVRKRVPGSRGTSGTPAALSTPPNALALLKALRRRWLLATGLGVLLAALVAVGIWLFLPAAKQSAYFRLYIAANPNPLLFKHPEAGDDFGRFQQLQAALIRSRPVLNAALRQPRVAQLETVRTMTQGAADPLEALDSAVRVDFPAPEILRITVEGDDPDELKVLANAIVEAYLLEVVSRQRQERKNRLDKLETLLKDAEDKVNRLHDRKRELAGPLGAGDVQALFLKQRIVAQQYSLVQNEVLWLSQKLQLLEREENDLKNQLGLPVNVSATEVDAEIDLDPVVRAQQALLAELDGKIKATEERLLPGARNQNLVLNGLKTDRETAAKALDARRKEIRPTAEATVRSRARAAIAARLNGVQENIRQDQSRKKVLEEDAKKLGEELARLNQGEFHLAKINRDLKHPEANLDHINDEINKHNAEKDDPDRVVRLAGEEPVAVRVDEFVRKLRIGGLAALAAFVLAVLGVALLEFRARRLYTVEEVSQGLGLRVVGTVPARPNRFQRLAASPEEWQARLTDAVDSARIMLLHTSKGAPVKAVLVASALGGEGKTSLASHLAVSLARAGRRTLLIDSDLRHPCAHDLFALSLAPGFGEVLRGEVEAGSACRPTLVPGLSMLTAGECGGQTLALLDQGRLPALLKQLKEQFDYVVVDSSPVLPVPDALLMARHVDRVLFSTLREVSRLNKIHAAYQKLAHLGIPVFGVVINGIRAESYYYYGQRARYEPAVEPAQTTKA
jgi:capsular exopolysaccharide synthesis family protein